MRRLVVALLLPPVLLAHVVATGLEQLDPEATVRRYLGAVKDGKLEDAYDLISKAMRQDKEKEVWVKEQRAMMAFADVKIFDFKVQPAKIEGDVARVPNVLSSQDRFANQLGLTEYELYTLVREDGAWKVDSQLIVEPPDIPKWFPDARKKEPAATMPSTH